MYMQYVVIGIGSLILNLIGLVLAARKSPASTGFTMCALVGMSLTLLLEYRYAMGYFMMADHTGMALPSTVNELSGYVTIMMLAVCATVLCGSKK